MSNDLESIKISEATSETSSESYDENQNKKQRIFKVDFFINLKQKFALVKKL